MADLSNRAEELKACCAAVYASDWARLLLGESLHPGGLALTERLGEMLGLRSGQRVLDVAAGTGASAMFLATRFECQVVGVDYSAEAMAAAAVAAARAGCADRVTFHQADAEHLPFPTASFDAVICECSFCTFPDKRSAAAELARVLRPSGAIGLADLTRNGLLPDELQTLLGWIACIGGARPVSEYVAYLQAAGFTQPTVESHDAALRQLVRDVRGRLLGMHLLTHLGKIALPGGNLEEAARLARAAASAIDEGRLGYSLLVAPRQ